MAYRLFEFIAGLIISFIDKTGLIGIFSLMSLESACIPIPSEVIMPFGGFLAAQGRFSLLAVALAGTLGCLFGSIPAYFLGAYGGRPLIEKYGRYVLISRRDLDLADRWFERYGEATIFVCRLLPVVRTFIAFPAGVARMNFTRFSIYTLLGSFPWCLGLAWVGFKLGEHWTVVREYFHRFDLLILAVIVILAGLYVYRHVKNERSLREEGGE